MDLSVPLEVGGDSEFHSDNTSGYRLNVGFEFESGELVDKLMDDLAHLRELYNFTDLLGTHVIEVGPGELFFLLYLS